MTGFGLWKPMNEAGTVTYDVPVERDGITRRISKAGLGFQVTKEARQDELHGKINQLPKALAKSGRHYQEITFWDLFNRGDSLHESMEGENIFGTHDIINPLRGITTITNKLAVPADLTETSLAAAMTHFDNLIDETGMPLPNVFKGNLLIVGRNLRHVAHRLHTAEFGSTLYDGGLTNTNGDVLKNAVNSNAGFHNGWDILVCDWLSSDDAWYLIDKNKHDFRWLWKDQPKLESADDFDTETTRYKSTMRFSTFLNKWRGVYKGQ
jgi:hypothetical protein